jgi:hypothetical protein
LTPKPVNTTPTKTNMIGPILGSFIGGILLSLGVFLSCKFYNNRKKQKTTLIMPVHEDYKYDQENSSVPVISVGKTRFSIANNERVSIQYTR